MQQHLLRFKKKHENKNEKMEEDEINHESANKKLNRLQEKVLPYRPLKNADGKRDLLSSETKRKVY